MRFEEMLKQQTPGQELKPFDNNYSPRNISDLMRNPLQELVSNMDKMTFENSEMMLRNGASDGMQSPEKHLTISR